MSLQKCCRGTGKNDGTGAPPPKSGRWRALVGDTPRRQSAKAVCVGDRIFLVGGVLSAWDSDPTFAHDAPMDVYGLDTTRSPLAWLSQHVKITHRNIRRVPVPRTGHVVVAAGTDIYIYGGQRAGAGKVGEMRTLHRIRTKYMEWDIPKVSGSGPKATFGSSGALLRNTIYIFGGRVSADGENLADLFALDLNTFTWTNILEKKGAALPRPKSSHSACAYLDRCMIVWGGVGEQVGSDTHGKIETFDVERKKWREVDILGEQPPPLASHSAFMHNGSMYVFGGIDLHPKATPATNLLFRFDPVENKWRKVKTEGKGPTSGDHSGCIVLKNKIYIIGGITTEPQATSATFTDSFVLEMR